MLFSLFVQEEIMEWWSATSEAGVEIPSEEDLIAKFKKETNARPLTIFFFLVK